MVSRRETLFDAANTAILVLVILLFVYPLLFVLVASLSDPRRIFENPLVLWPQGFQLDSYRTVFERSEILTGYRNSVLYTVCGTLLGLVLTVLGAYPLSRPDFRGRGAFTVFFTFTMFFSGGLIPTYLVVESLGMVNTVWAMIVPGSVSVYNMVLMRTYFQSRIPAELREAGVMDGCGNWRLLLQICLPLSMPIIAVMILFYGVAHWKSYFNGLIYLTRRDLFSLQLLLRELLVQNETDRMMTAMTDYNLSQRLMQREGLQYAIIVVSSAPLLILYPIIGRYFKEGITVGALKG